MNSPLPPKTTPARPDRHNERTPSTPLDTAPARLASPRRRIALVCCCKLSFPHTLKLLSQLCRKLFRQFAAKGLLDALARAGKFLKAGLAFADIGAAPVLLAGKVELDGSLRRFDHAQQLFFGAPSPHRRRTFSRGLFCTQNSTYLPICKNGILVRRFAGYAWDKAASSGRLSPPSPGCRASWPASFGPAASAAGSSCPSSGSSCSCAVPALRASSSCSAGALFFHLLAPVFQLALGLDVDFPPRQLGRASRAFWPSLPMASDSWSSGTMARQEWSLPSMTQVVSAGASASAI